MSPLRRRFVGWFIGLLLGAHVIAIVRKFDDWPISCYPMFSGIQDAQYRLTTLHGVSADGREFLLDESQFWKPMRLVEIHSALRQNARRDRKLRKKDPAADSKTQQAVQALFGLYEQNRAAGLHVGPRLVALRLYNTTWELDPHLRNLDSPIAQELVHEAAAPQDVD
jgi:hypothetical protein